MDIEQYKKEIEKIVNEIAAEYKARLVDDDIKDPKLTNFDTTVQFNDKEFSISFDLPAWWKYMEYGRGPGKMPPMNVIQDWIQVKRIIPRAVNGRIPDTRQLAYVIARSIGENGTPGKHIIDKTLKDPYVESLVDKLKQAIVNVTLLKMVDEITKN